MQIVLWCFARRVTSYLYLIFLPPIAKHCRIGRIGRRFGGKPPAAYGPLRLSHSVILLAHTPEAALYVRT